MARRNLVERQGRLPSSAACLLVYGMAAAVPSTWPRLAGAEPAIPSACVISGRPSHLQIVVQPADEKPLSLEVHALAVHVVPPALGTLAQVRVATPLTLVGTTPEPRYRVRQPLAAASGMLRLSSAAILSAVVARDATVRSSVHLAPGCSTGAQLEDVELPCAALELDPQDGAPPPGGGYRKDEESYRYRWTVADPTFTLQERPGTGVELRVHVSALWSFRLAVLSREGTWSHVVQHLEDGSALTGWLPTRELRSWLGYGVTTVLEVSPGCAEPRPDRLTASALIAPGTPVYAQPGRGQWATVTTDSGFQVRNTPEGLWLQVTHVPGITNDGYCTQLTHAWVRRDAVHLMPPDRSNL